MENFQEEHCPQCRARHPFLFMPQFIKDLKTLMFAGDDALITCSGCFKGISFFSLAPLSEFGVDGCLHDQHLQCKETTSQHHPSDCPEMDALSEGTTSVPSDQNSLHHWTDHAEISLGTFFVMECPLVHPFHDLNLLMLDSANCTDWSPVDFKVLTWSIHWAAQWCWWTLDTSSFEHVVADMRAGMCLAQTNLPSQLTSSKECSGVGTPSLARLGSPLGDTPPG